MSQHGIPHKEAHRGMAKTGAWLIGIGCLIGLFGLTILPAALKSGEDKTILSLCVLTISFAMMVTSSGLYMKARSHAGSSDSYSASAKRRGKANCDSCGKREPVILCRVHQLHLCSDCLATHYDFRSCAYVPSTRRGSAKASTLSQASGL